MRIVLFFFAVFLTACGAEYQTVSTSNRVDSFQFERSSYENFQSKLTCEYNQKFEERIIQTKDSCRIYIREIGSGDPIILLHGGWGHELSSIYSAFRYLQKKHRLIFYDQRGSLRSFCKKPDAITVENHVDDLEKIRKTLDLDSFTLIAHSMGGYLAMKYLQQYGDQHLNQMILVSSLPPKFQLRDFNEFQEKAIERWERPSTKKVLKQEGLDSNLKTEKKNSLWHRVTFASVNLHDVNRWPWFEGAFTHNNIAGNQSNLSMERTFKCPSFFPKTINYVCFKIDNWLFRSFDFRKSIDQAEIPIYFVHGDDDFIQVESQLKTIKKAPNYQLKIVENAGHVIWIDQPKVITHLIPNLLKQ
jgi:pimeloyl-ACP methyl ester carboxylesterase